MLVRVLGMFRSGLFVPVVFVSGVFVVRRGGLGAAMMSRTLGPGRRYQPPVILGVEFG